MTNCGTLRLGQLAFSALSLKALQISGTQLSKLLPGFQMRFFRCVSFRRVEFCEHSTPSFQARHLVTTVLFEVESSSTITFTGVCLVKRQTFATPPFWVQRGSFGQTLRAWHVLAMLHKRRQENKPECRFWETWTWNAFRFAMQTSEMSPSTIVTTWTKQNSSACLWNKAFNRQRVLYDELALRGCKPSGEQRKLIKNQQ